MSFLRAIFSRERAKRKEYLNITRDKDPQEQWNQVAEIGDGAFGKVYKVRRGVVAIIYNIFRIGFIK